MTMLKPRSGMRLTVEEFMELPELWDKRKMELDEGVLYIVPKPTESPTDFCNSGWAFHDRRLHRRISTNRQRN